MLKISKVLILSLLVVSMASAAFATTSRVQALAGTSNYINDDSDIFRWYGTLPSYTKLVMVEAGQATGDVGEIIAADFQALGFTHNWGEDHWLGTWGVFLLFNSVEDRSFFTFNPLGTPGSEGTVVTPTTKFVLMLGNEVEDMLSWGVTFTRSDASIETPTLGENDISLTTIGAGIRVDLGDEAYADLAVTFGFAGGDTLGGFDKGTSWDLAGRLFYEWFDDVTLVPFAGWRHFDYALENVAATSGLQVNDFQAGASLNMDVNTNNLLIFATEIEFVSTEPSKLTPGDPTDRNDTILPKFFVALESDVNSWLTTRVGATKTMTKTETTDDAGADTTVTAPVPGFGGPGSDFAWFLGAGFHVGDWDIDAVLSEDLPFRLGYWLTGFGAADSDPPVGRISGTYRF